MDLHTASQQLISALKSFMAENPVDAILFSGGIDTSLLASIAYQLSKPALITVIFKDAHAPDLHFSTLAAKTLGAEHHIKFFDLNEAIRAARKTIYILRTFDPVEIRNSIPILIGLEFAKKLGFRTIMTGDGGDELFAGYSFLLKMQPQEVETWIQKTVKTWSFSSNTLAKALGLTIVQPFTNKTVVNTALKIPINLKISKLNNKTIGKFILRKILESTLSPEIAWRNKDPIELGSGTSSLPQILNHMISDEEFRQLSKEVKLRSKEQALYFKIFKSLGLKIPKAKNSTPCKYCGAPTSNNFCKTCGAYPAT
ncbi:MAG: asparagine synthase C-terminal domain-containing protein [Candidatus Baldrarchaeia archaeon]